MNQNSFALRIRVFALCLAGLPLTLFSQDWDCNASLVWAKQTFEANDAGFTLHLDRIGEPQYELYTQKMLAQSKTVQAPEKCVQLIGEWLRFFRKEHLGIALKNVAKDRKPTQENAVQAHSPDTVRATPEVQAYRTYLKAHRPSLRKLSEQTFLLRVPHMWYQFKTEIDSLVRINLQELTHTPNLIIDIRNNGGGSDYTYEALFPLAYTNPIRTIGAEFKSTTLNNQMLAAVVKEPTLDREVREWAQQLLDKSAENLDSFIPMDSTKIEITCYDTILPYPKNIAILIDENVASASEQFLLGMKQSRKVKLYGVTTAGGLDLANVNEVESPCGNFLFSYALSRSMRIPEMEVDGKGIQPDYYLDQSIPDHHWIAYVQQLLEAQ